MIKRTLQHSGILLAIFSLSIFCSSSTCQQKAGMPSSSVSGEVVEPTKDLENKAEIEQQMDSVRPEEKYRNVYESLVGEWRGEFVVYEDTRGQIRGRPVRAISEDYINDLPLKEVNRIQVMHRYTATDDFTVVAEIEDRWLDEKGKEVLSAYPAENNVRGDELFCIVDKPEEKVVHKGFIDDEGYIIWSRDEELPLRKEYFKEKAVGNTYSIIGYGYYGDDNPNLSPKLWFKGSYTKAD